HDQMQLARGAPATFSASVDFALARLAGLAEGTITLTDSTLAVTGIAATPASYAAGRQAFRASLPQAMDLGPVDILPARAEPFVWSASYDGKSLTLDGYVPNEIVHEALIASARATLTGADIVDHAAVASGEPDGF